MKKKINATIDADGGKVNHVNAYVSASNELVIESGSKGTESEIDFTSGTDAVLDNLLGTYVSSDGAATYNGATVAANSTTELYVNDILLEFSATAAITNGDSMTSSATTIQSSINVAISSYNTATGKTSGQEGFIEDVTVSVSDEGRFIITSESGPVELVDNDGSTFAADLGLSTAQTNASENGGMKFQIGANKGQSLTFGINDMRTAALGVAGLDLENASSAANAIDKIDSALNKVSSQRSTLGAVQNRLEHTIKNLDASSENLQASESRIRDVDMAKEMMEFTKNNILSQAAQSMLAQANQAPQGVLQLLR